MIDGCVISTQWNIALDFAERVADLINLAEAEMGIAPTIISGFRTDEKQRQLIREGVGTAVNLSNHTVCPARAVDLWMGPFVTRAQKATLGRIAFMLGLRWGGGSRPDEGGIPEDWAHFDEGPRN